MHKCKHKGCNNVIKDRYTFCFQHKDDPYIAKCFLHGKTTFKSGVCLKCKKLRTPIYRLHKRKNKYYVGKKKKALPNNYFLKPYYKPLLYPNKRYQKKYIKRIIKGPGTYGIFVRDNRCYRQLGKCLYVGQSTNIHRRINEHKANIKIAAAHLKKLKVGKRVWLIDKSKLKVPLVYYKIATHGVSNLKYATLFSIDKKFYSKCDLDQALICLTFFEQLGMDTYKPRYNVIAARPTSKNQF